MDESAPRALRSSIWDFFDRGASDATCRTCKMRLKTPTGTTTTLVNHLKRHPNAFKNFEKLRAAEGAKKATGPKKTTGTKATDASAASSSFFKTTLKGDAPRAKLLTKKVAQFVAAGLHPYSIVEEPGFLSLMHATVPEYKVPSRTTFSRSVVPELYAKERERIQSELHSHFSHGTPCYSVTTDGWTSRPGDSYVSFTCHLLDEEFRPRNYHLACRHMPEGHTSGNLKRVLLDLAEEWGLPQDCPVFIVTDNARNFLGAASQTGWTSIQCFAHTLQLCIHSAKRDTPNFEQLCAKARTIVGHYKRSSLARSRLRGVQESMGMEPLEVVQDVPTRWNSEYEMLSRLLKLRRPISLDLSEQDSLEDFGSAEWRLMTAVTSVLKCVDDATRECCSERHPTLSQVVPLVHCLQLLLTQQQQSCGEESTFAKNLLHAMKCRFGDIKLQVPYAFSTALDPRFKAVCFDTCERQWLKGELCSSLEKNLHQEQEEEEPTVSHAPAQAVCSDVWNVFGSLAASSTSSSTHSQRLKEEVEEYFHTPVQPRSENPLLWWKNFGAAKYPSLSGLARLYLSVPATQVSSERLFSATGNVVTARREHLLPEHVEQLVFLHSSMH